MSKMVAKKQHNFTCIVCGKTKYLPPCRMKKHPRYCSNACRAKDWTGENSPTWKGGLTECICKNCGKMFYVKPSHIKKGEGKYCSCECHYEARRGTEMLHLRNRIVKYCKVCGKKIELRKSREYTTEGSYCSMKCRSVDYRKTMIGKNNPNWRGGKIEIFCKMCGKGYLVTPALKDKSKFCSVSCAATWRTMHTQANYGKRSRSGKRDDLNGLYVRSSWEANYARYLNWLVSIGEIVSWEYEPDEFEFPVKRGSRFYLPDFRVLNCDGSIEYHEVKGYMDAKSATKLKRMAKYYPKVELILIDKDVYYAIKKDVHNIINCWED